MARFHPGSRAQALTIVFSALLGMAGCRPAPKPALPNLAAGEGMAFEGTWSATGHRRILQLGADRRASIADFSGSLLLTGPDRPGVGFQAEAIVFNDSATGMTGRSVWTDERGDQVFSQLQGDATDTGSRITGKVLGGTGRYQDVAGTFEFSWRFVLEAPDGTLQGQAVGFRGMVLKGSRPFTPPAPEGPRP